ncbi:DUF6090 family protein [Lentiprolixibacter aurantiacus]|uniref:DUF6090 family protein n=1 Tax=Lentiprolixibacter aurantiacus TaxID=2993939 RepID=A0AAE3MM64_9FLAO|nr:DUF6090 family protein [Lentiprolixibacter aurantiacus]MCX2719753.1 DUF6090 family protein [Lentiprolixibacter aurantiacus]
MIKFFRKIRQRLLSENKFRKYLIYAIGEIILIVIGVLLAVAINDQISKSNERKLEKQLLINIRKELMSNIDQLKIAIKSHEEGSHAGTELLTTIRYNANNLEINNLDTLMFLMDFNWSYDPAIGSIKSTIESGGVNIIRSDSIREYILSFEDRVKDVNETTLGYRRLKHERLWPLIDKNISILNRWDHIYPKIGKSKHEQDYATLFKNQEFENVVGLLLIFREEGLIEERALLNYCIKIEELIGKQLGQAD